MEYRDTVIVNGYDIIWDEVNIRTRALDIYFFKEDPVTYLRNLANDNWHIIIYFPVITDYETNRIKDMGRPVYIKTKMQIITMKFRKFSTIIELKGDETISTIITRYLFSPASFIIIDPERDFNIPISRYSPSEIFGFVDPPPVIPNAIYLLFPDSAERYNWIKYDIYMVSADRDERIDFVRETKNKNPNRPIVQIWTPVFRYPPGTKKEDLNYFYNLIPPYMDNVPGVIYYNYGF